VAAAFFRAWEQRQYDRMYELLSESARQTTSREMFVRRYTSIHDGIGVSRIVVTSQPPVEEPVPAQSPVPKPQAAVGATPSPNAQAGISATPPPRPAAPTRAMRVRFDVTRSVPIFGDLAESNELRLVQEQGLWRVAWQPGLIFRDLTPTSSVRLIPDNPARGRILDRSGQPLADNGAILSVGVVPGQIQDEPALLAALNRALGLESDAIKRRYQGSQPDWFMPITDRSNAERGALEEALGSVPGVVLREKPARVYPLGEAAAHVVGFVTRATADDLRRLRDQGYDEDDWIGRTGLEGWGESHLAGKKGGRIVISDDRSAVLRVIAERKAVPGADIVTTLDAPIQAQAAEALGDKTGSAVVMDPRDNSLLAVTSRPSFDPNRFIIGLTDAEWQALNQPGGPLVFRAAESTYPIGSTFKVVTMAAGLERGGVKTSETFDCGLEWRGLPGVVLHNWTAQGRLDLVESLSQSCNPAFYAIGLKLDQADPGTLPAFARAFGLGQPTGVQGIEEAAGVVPDPEWKQRQIGQPWTHGDAVNLAIGQGYLLATPLQVANAYAALANGGTLRTPLLMKSVRGEDGNEQPVTAQERGRLPISDATRAAILEGMRRATSTPNGTAASAFRGSRVQSAAKTGSAENEGERAHAWIVGFATPQQPAVLALVMVERGEQSSTVAAPLGRQVLEHAYERRQK
jgi:penicillin-binding protein 2